MKTKKKTIRNVAPKKPAAHNTLPKKVDGVQAPLTTIRTPKPSFTSPTVRRHYVLLVSIIILSVILYPASLSVQAASSRIYANNCLGGFQRPNLAGGEPQLNENADPSEYTDANSAILRASTASIFCGYFISEHHDNAPRRITLIPSWNLVIEHAAELPLPEPAPTPEPEPTPEPVPTPETPSEPEIPAADPVLENTNETAPSDTTQTSATLSIASVRLAQEDTAVLAVPEVIPDEQSTTEPVLPPDTSEAVPEVQPESPSTSPKPEIFEQPFTSTSFLHVAYSTDGVTWHSLGDVNASNWKQFRPEIPIRSWDEIDMLQISFASQPTFDAQPTVMLDGLWLDIEYDPTFTESVQDVSEAMSSFVANVFDAFTNLFDQPSEEQIVPPETPQAVTEEITPTSTSTTTPAEPEPREVTITRLTFDADGSGAMPTDKELPWLTREELESLATDDKKPVATIPSILERENGKSLVLSGSCAREYYVIVLYKNADDYKEHPSDYIFNKAETCANGSFRFDLGNIPPTIPEGSYYLLIGEQGNTGSWSPASALVPIRIGSITETEIIP